VDLAVPDLVLVAIGFVRRRVFTFQEPPVQPRDRSNRLPPPATAVTRRRRPAYPARPVSICR
jgi:hypothetical protein